MTIRDRVAWIAIPRGVLPTRISVCKPFSCELLRISDIASASARMIIPSIGRPRRIWIFAVYLCCMPGSGKIGCYFFQIFCRLLNGSPDLPLSFPCRSRHEVPIPHLNLRSPLLMPALFGQVWKNLQETEPAQLYRDRTG
jgi:hypothetical protein